jgi:hypothetical protein
MPIILALIGGGRKIAIFKAILGYIVLCRSKCRAHLLQRILRSLVGCGRELGKREVGGL